jgi:hypothetical protein
VQQLVPEQQSFKVLTDTNSRNHSNLLDIADGTESPESLLLVKQMIMYIIQVQCPTWIHDNSAFDLSDNGDFHKEILHHTPAQK